MSRVVLVLAVALALGCESPHERAVHAREAGRTALEAHHLDDAIRALFEADGIEPGQAETLRLLARAQMDAERYADVVTTLARIEAPSADDLELRARAELAQEHWSEAVAAIEATLAADERRSALLSPMGRALEHLDRVAEAEAAYRRAAVADLEEVEPRLALARLWLAARAPEEVDPCPPALSILGAAPAGDAVLTGGAVAAGDAVVPADGSVERCLGADVTCIVRVRAREVLMRADALLAEDAAEAETVAALLADVDALDAAHETECRSSLLGVVTNAGILGAIGRSGAFDLPPPTGVDTWSSDVFEPGLGGSTPAGWGRGAGGETGGAVRSGGLGDLGRLRTPDDEPGARVPSP